MSDSQQPQQKSISSAVFGLQDSLRNLQQSWTCLEKNNSDQVSDNHKKPNELHALGIVNLDQVREEFSKHVNIIRSVCSQFETEVLGDVMKMGAGADPAFRKHFTHLKEQATLESTVVRVKDTLKKTKEFFEKTIREKEESKSKIETERLKKLAESMGLMSFIDTSKVSEEAGMPITTITLGGTVIVVDIDIDDAGKVLRTKVTYVSDTLQNDQDDRVDQILTDNLQAQDFDLFKRNLRSLALLDQLNVKYQSTDFFLIIKNLLADLKTICQQEINSVESNIETVLLEGHGIPNQHLEYPGISIAYWMDKEHINNSNWKAIKEAFERGESHPSLCNTSRLLISFEDSIQPVYYLPKTRSGYLVQYNETEETVREEPDGEHLKVITETSAPKFMRQMQFVKPLPSNPASQPASVRFVLTLDPPMLVSDEVAQKLMSVTGLLNMEPTALTRNENSTTQSLEEMLVGDADTTDGLASSHSWTYSSENMPDQIYKRMEVSSTSAKVVSRIPFHHPVQLYNILQCIRQQQMFNTLFKSIFNKTTFKKVDQTINKPISLSLMDILAESEVDNSLRIEIATLDAPNSICISLSPPSLQNQKFIMIVLSIDISIETPTKPTVRFNSPSSAASKTQYRWDSQVFDEEKMSEILQSTYSVPLFIQWLYERMSNSESYLVDRKRTLQQTGADSYLDFEDSNKMMKMEIDE